jgi:hypothetical protein
MIGTISNEVYALQHVGIAGWSHSKCDCFNSNKFVIAQPKYGTFPYLCYRTCDNCFEKFKEHGWIFLTNKLIDINELEKYLILI